MADRVAVGPIRLREALLRQAHGLVGKDGQPNQEMYVEHEGEGYEAVQVVEVDMEQGLVRVLGRGGVMSRVMTADELVVLASRRFGGQLGVTMDGLRDAVAKNADLSRLDGTLNEGSLLEAIRNGVSLSAGCLRCGPALVALGTSTPWKHSITTSSLPGEAPHPCDAARAAFQALLQSSPSTPSRQGITVLGSAGGMMHARDHILRALVEPQRGRVGGSELVGRLGTALGVLSSVLSLDGHILYSPSEVRLLYRMVPSTRADDDQQQLLPQAELVGASLDVYLIERDPVKYEGFLDLLSGPMGARALGLDSAGLATLLPQSANQSGRTIGAILRAVEDLGVSSNEALRCLRSMAVSSILSRATTPLSPALYRVFDYLAAPNRLSKAAIQRVGQSERDLKQLAREVFSSAAGDFVGLLNTALAPPDPHHTMGQPPALNCPLPSQQQQQAGLSSISVLAIPAPSLSSKLGRFSDLASAYGIIHSLSKMTKWLAQASPDDDAPSAPSPSPPPSSSSPSPSPSPAVPSSPDRATDASEAQQSAPSAPQPSPSPSATQDGGPAMPLISTEMDDAIRGLVDAVNRATLDRVAEHKMEGELKASLKLGKADDVTLPWGETLLAKPLIRLNATALPPALSDFLGKRRANWGGTVLDGLVSWVERVLDEASGCQLVCCMDVRGSSSSGGLMPHQAKASSFDALKVVQQIRLYKLVQAGLSVKHGPAIFTAPTSSSSSTSLLPLASSLLASSSASSMDSGRSLGGHELKKTNSPATTSVLSSSAACFTMSGSSGLLHLGGFKPQGGDLLGSNKVGGKGGGARAGRDEESQQLRPQEVEQRLGVAIGSVEAGRRQPLQQQQGGGGEGGLRWASPPDKGGLLDALRRSDSVWEEARRVQEENRALRRRNEQLEAQNAELLLLRHQQHHHHGGVDGGQGWEAGSEAHQLSQLSGMVRENVHNLRAVIWEVFRFDVNKEGAVGLRRLRDEIVGGLDGLIAVEDAIEKTRNNIGTGVQAIPRGF